MAFTVNITGHADPTDQTEAGNAAAAQLEQTIADRLAAVIEATNSLNPGTILAATFAGQFVSEDLLPVIEPPVVVDPALVADADDLRAVADKLDPPDAPTTNEQLMADATQLRSIADQLDPPASSQPPVTSPPPTPAGTPGTTGTPASPSFVAKVQGESYADYQGRVNAWNSDPANATTPVVAEDEATWDDVQPDVPGDNAAGAPAQVPGGGTSPAGADGPASASS